MRGRHDSNVQKPETQSIRSNSLNKSESVNSKCTEHGAEESPRRLMGLKWNQGGILFYGYTSVGKKIVIIFFFLNIAIAIINIFVFQ